MARVGRRAKRGVPDDGLVQFGEYLKREREFREISLDELARETKIGRAFLESIERGRVEILPPVTFVKGFLRAYASYLGLDPNDVILRFEQALMGKGGLGFRESLPILGGRRFSTRSLGLPLLLVCAAGLLTLVLRLIPNDNAWDGTDPMVRQPLTDGGREDPEQLKRRLREELGLLDKPASQRGVGPSVAAATTPPSRTGTATSAAQTPAPPPEARPPTPMSPTTAPSPSPVPTASPAGPSHLLVVTGLGPSCSVRVEADGGPPKEKWIGKREKETWQAREKFDITLGNAGCVRVSLDGRDLGSPGKSGEMLRLTLPPTTPGPSQRPTAPATGAEPGSDPDAQD